MSAFRENKKRDLDTKVLKRNEILTSYQNIVAMVGFEAASLSRISKEVGIPTSLIFHYFENKQQMTYALVDHVIEICVHESIPKADLSNPDYAAEFETYIDTLLDVRRNRYNLDPRVFNACSGLGSHDEIVAQKFKTYYETALSNIYDHIVYFSSKGIIKVEDPILAARFTVLLVDGLENVWEIWTELSVPHERITLEARRTLMDFLKYKK